MCGGWYGKHRDITLPQSLPRSRSRVTRIKAKDRSRRNRIKRLEESGIEGEGRTESCRFRIRGTLSRGSYKDRSCARYYWPHRVGPTRVRLPKLLGTRWPWSGEYHVE
ncbi:hypothetical protein BHM03_00028510 [Ensete ventricosum]|nr:hypothetical protein BHM03_00028510 [Ensete ventricosum]